MGCAARDIGFAEVPRCDLAVARRTVELAGRVVVQARGLLQCLVHREASDA